jgi:uncharacterized membrane protein YphA (DoxX/SURF4 family)
MKDVGLLLLGIWLIASGLKTVIGLNFRYDSLVLAILAIVAGILVVLRR